MDTVTISATLFNSQNDLVTDSTIILYFESEFIDLVESYRLNGTYYWRVLSSGDGELTYAISEKNSKFETLEKSILFLSKDDALVIEDFEKGNVQGWGLSSHWELSKDNPISGTQSIKHKVQTENGTSFLPYTNNQYQLSEKEFFFSFKLKNGNWNPSSSNLFYLWLMADGSANGSGGYAIGVNALGSSDLLTLWSVHNGKPDKIIAETTFEWIENTTAQIDVVRSPWGDWKLNVTNLKTGQSFAAIGFDDEFQLVKELNLVFGYTTTRSGQLWFDDLIVIGQNAPPFIANVIPISHDKFQVIFNENIKMDKLNAENLKLNGERGEIYEILSIEKVSPTTLIITTDLIREIDLNLTAYSLVDSDGKVTSESVFQFENTLPAYEKDIVFTEIMSDPNPPVGLVEAEYLELFNRSNKNIQLENWVLFVRNSSWKLPKKVILPGEYLILCDNDFESQFLKMGSVLAFNTFPSLLNAGAKVSISNSSGVLIDEVTYNENWHVDNIRKNGGYSLEKIDNNRFCGESGNWTSSHNSLGGTPGKINSVNAENIDLLAPELLAIDIVSYQKLELILNEPLDSVSARNKSNVSITGLNVLNVEYKVGESKLTVLLQNELKLNVEYQLTLKNISDQCGNVSAEMQLPIMLVSLKPGDIIINEVLFNPYTGGADFVELYNQSGLTIDIADLKLATRNDSLQLKTVYNVSKLHGPFKNKSFLAFSKDTASILSNYYVPFPENLKQMASFPTYNDDEGRVVLLDDSLLVLDEFAYNQNMHSEWLSVFDGVSLERLSFSKPSTDISNWHSASSLVGYATPGYENSQTEIGDNPKVVVEIENKVITPNGDGYNDDLIIKFKLDQLDYVANIIIFDAIGREVKRLTNNDLIANNSEIVFDLVKDDGSLISMGAYVVFTELIHLKVKKQVFKNTFLVSDR